MRKRDVEQYISKAPASKGSVAPPGTDVAAVGCTGKQYENSRTRNPVGSSKH